MWYKAENVKYWQRRDNKCQFELGGKARMIIKCLLSATYINCGLAQKLQYCCSPNKNTYW